MNSFNFFVAFAVALIATTCAIPNYGGAENAADYAQSASGDAAVAPAGEANYAGSASAPAGAYAGSYSQPNLPYSPQNTRGNTVTSSISYPHNKGEILIHRPAAIIVKRPPTKVLVNHPPLVVKPAPVVLHKPPAVVLRKVLVKHHPRPVKVEPVYVNVVKPPAEKYFVNEKQQYSSQPTSYSPANAPAAYSAGHENAAASGYQLLSSNQGLAALAGLAGGNAGGNAGNYAGPASAQYGNSAAY